MKDSAVRWLYSASGSRKIYIAGLTLLHALHGASGVLYALLLKRIVDAAVAQESAAFAQGMTGIVLLVAVQLGIRALIRWLTEFSHADFENLFKHRLFRSILDEDYLRVSAVHSGEWLNRLTGDTKVVADNAVDILPGMAGMIVKLVCALIMIITLEPRFAWILLPGGLAMLFLTWLFRRILKRLHKNIQEADGRLRVFMQERIGSMMMIRSFGAQRRTEADHMAYMAGHKAARMRRNWFSNLCNIGFGAAMNGMYLLGVGWCGYGILTGTVTFGTLTAVTQLISQIQAPFANITGYLPKYYAMLASAERLREAELFPEEKESEDGRILDPAEVRELYKNLQTIGLRDVSFRYYPVSDSMEMLSKEGMPAVLDDFSLEIKKGEFVALTGKSGCGKSTALKLLMCVYRPDDGERYYVDEGGQEHALTAGHRRLFAYVPQGNVLMSGTIREVVSYADPEAAGDDARLWRALEIACADTFVRELEYGPETLLGERGKGLSEGQMQRLAVARAVFAKSPVLLLDEATSALDAETERRLLKNLRKLTDKTVLIVTHRQTAAEMCSRVLSLQSD